MNVQKMRPNEILNLTGEVNVSFFNELDTGKKKNYAQGSSFNPQLFVSFFK